MVCTAECYLCLYFTVHHIFMDCDYSKRYLDSANADCAYYTTYVAKNLSKSIAFTLLMKADIHIWCKFTVSCFECLISGIFLFDSLTPVLNNPN